MRTLLLIFVCIGTGFALAKYQLNEQTRGISNYLGSAEDRNAAIVEGLARSQTGKIEVVNGADLDFGTMMRQSKRSHTFILKNVGGEDVGVRYLSSTCKCTVGKLENTVLKPGETTDVNLEWTAIGALDEFSQTATIGTTAPDQEEVKLTVHGIIGNNYAFDPPNGNAGDFLSTQETEISATLYSFEESPLEITSIGIQDAVLSKSIRGEMGEVRKLEKGEVPKYADARYSLDFKITLSPGIPAGNISGNMMLVRPTRERNEDPEMLAFPIFGRCVTPVRVIAGADYNERRNIFDLGTAKPGDGLKKSFMVGIKNEDAANVELRIGKVVPADYLKVTIGDPIVSEVQKIYPITLEVAPGTSPIDFGGSFSKGFGKIVLETDMETAPQIPMFIRFRITE